MRARVGNYAALGPRTQQAIPDSRLVRFPELGHSPQVQDPAHFNARPLQELDILK